MNLLWIGLNTSTEITKTLKVLAHKVSDMRKAFVVVSLHLWLGKRGGGY